MKPMVMKTMVGRLRVEVSHQLPPMTFTLIGDVVTVHSPQEFLLLLNEINLAQERLRLGVGDDGKRGEVA